MLAGLVLSLPTCFSALPAKGHDSDRARLVAAVGEHRLLHGRAIGGFAFGPERSRKRGASGLPEVPFEVLRVSADLRQRFDADPSPMATGNLALAYLFTGDAEKGVRLSELRVLEQETPEALVDLATAYLQRAIDEDAHDQFTRAYDAALRALRLRPGQKEALFNRAMAADGVGLAWIARQAWDEYLAAEPEGPWSDIAREARARAARREADNDRAAHDRPRILAAWAADDVATVREVALRRPDLARELVRREAIPAVARAKLERRPLGPSLALARELDEVARAADRDTLDEEALAALERGDLELAAAHIEFASASQALDDRNVDAGSPGVLHAAGVFRRKGSPYAAQAELQSALVEFFHGQRDGLISRYTSLLARYQGRYPLLRARALWMRALCHGLVASNKWQALLDRQEAFTILTDARQVDAARQSTGNLLESLTLMGREAEADALLEKILHTLSLDDVPLRTYVCIRGLIERLKDSGLGIAALEVLNRSQDEISKAAPILGVDAALSAVQLATQLDDRVGAARFIERARRSLGSIDDQQIRLEEGIVLALATLSAGGPTDPGTSGVDALIATLRSRKNEAFLASALTLLGERRAIEGRPELAETALREALGIDFASRSKTIGEFERIRQFEGAEQTGDDLVDLLDATGRFDESLALIERLRHPDALGRFPMALPAGQAAVSYWTLKDRILVTVLTERGGRHVSLPVGRSKLRNLVDRLRASLDVESDALAAAPRSELYHALISPLLPALGAARQLVIVADRELWDIPFAGLSPALHAEPLAGRFEISFAPSLAALSSAREWTQPRSLLAVGGPSWDGSSFPDLRPLPESLTEARDVAALYERSRVLSGPDATIATFQRVAPGFDVVHVATHAVGNDRDPGQSFILLSADGSDPGAWRAADPGWAALSGARLVILSACRTGSERSRFGGASLGVLRSIQRGSRAQTLVSTGDVDDAAARRLLEVFHRKLLAGRTPAAALQEAQMEAYKGGSGTTWMLYRIVI